MSKITTEDCVAVIEKHFAKANPTLTEYVPHIKWKRLSKTGKKDEPVIRVFSSNYFPVLQAKVREIDGKITDLAFEVVPPWDLSDDAEILFAKSIFDDPTSGALGTKRLHNLDDFYEIDAIHNKLIRQLEPKDFVFAVATGAAFDVNDNDTLLVVTPLSYWKRTGCCYDQELSEYLRIYDDADQCRMYGYLPMSANVEVPEELSEGQFLITGKHTDIVKKQMLERGFVFEQEFQDFIDPVEHEAAPHLVDLDAVNIEDAGEDPYHDQLIINGMKKIFQVERSNGYTMDQLAQAVNDQYHLDSHYEQLSQTSKNLLAKWWNIETPRPFNEEDEFNETLFLEEYGLTEEEMNALFL